MSERDKNDIEICCFTCDSFDDKYGRKCYVPQCPEHDSYDFCVENNFKHSKTSLWRPSVKALEARIVVLKAENVRLLKKIDHMTVAEMCPHCGQESHIDTHFERQPCEHCGELIVPCSICGLSHFEWCEKCPLERKGE